MKHSIVFALTVALLAACSTKEVDFQTPVQDDVIFYASFEQPAEVGTRVYANEDLLLRWTADDRVSIFNKITYNQEYKFLGETGDNAGGFNKVDNAEFVTGNAISHVVSVYPYQEATKISESEVLTVTLPAEQTYAQNTFGLGANTMVSVSSDNVLQYKNVGGFLVFKLYGEGVSVSSITLKGNNGEKLAGKATVSMPMGGIPLAAMTSDVITEITLICQNPVELGASEEDGTQFWFVVPPLTFSKGFTISVNETTGGIVEKSTSKSISVERSKVSKMASMRVEKAYNPNNIIYYTSTDGAIVTPYRTDVFGANIVANEYHDGLGFIAFDGAIERIGNKAFYDCTTLESIILKSTILSIGVSAFKGCSSLSSIEIPDSVVSIADEAFSSCKRIFIGSGATSISSTAFSPARIQSLVVSEDNSTYDSRNNCNSLIETASNTLICGGKESTIPEGVEIIGMNAFLESGMETIIIPSTVRLIKERAFSNYNVFKKVYSYAIIPPTLEFMSPYNYWHPFYSSLMWSYETTVFVPNSSYQEYISKWGSLRSITIERMDSGALPEAVDLGLSVKWASFNLGASSPEEYGDYYAWGETESKEDYSWATYKWCKGDYNTMTKYCNSSEYGYNAFTDTKTVLDLEDDAARANWGGTWRMPTDSEWTELINACTWTWTTRNGVNGRLVTASNGSSVFLPAAGCWSGTSLCDVGSNGAYWSSSLNTAYPSSALDVNFNSSLLSRSYNSRYFGFTVRPVSE